MCWVLGLAHNKYKWSSQDNRLTSREKKKSGICGISMERCTTLPREKGASNPQETELWFLFLSTFLSPLHEREEERLICSGIFGKGATQVCFAPLDYLIFEGCLRLSSGLLVASCGRPWVASYSSGLEWACPVLRGGWSSEPYPPKQLWLVTMLTFPHDPMSLTWFWIWSVQGMDDGRIDRFLGS